MPEYIINTIKKNMIIFTFHFYILQINLQDGNRCCIIVELYFLFAQQ